MLCRVREVTKMEKNQTNASKTTNPVSLDLLMCGSGKGIHDKLLLNPKDSATLRTEKVPRSCVLDRLQNFLPQMALANEALQQQIEAAPAGHFDIESVEDSEKVIEMDVALVELEDSDSSEEEESSENEDSSSEEDTVTEEKLKLPGNKKRKANIQVLQREGE